MKPIPKPGINDDDDLSDLPDYLKHDYYCAIDEYLDLNERTKKAFNKVKKMWDKVDEYRNKLQRTDSTRP